MEAYDVACRAYSSIIHDMDRCFDDAIIEKQIAAFTHCNNVFVTVKREVEDSCFQFIGKELSDDHV
jgi:hypothetical protein